LGTISSAAVLIRVTIGVKSRSGSWAGPCGRRIGDRHARAREEQRVPVRRGFRDVGGADRSAGAAPRLHDDRTPSAAATRSMDDRLDQLVAAAGRDRIDERDARAGQSWAAASRAASATSATAAGRDSRRGHGRRDSNRGMA
jgi:hypothetical protein